MSMPNKSSKWHPADQQPCLTCKRWIPIDIPIHFLGMGYECHKCYSKRTSLQVNIKPEPQQQQQQNGRLCSECKQPDYTYKHEVKNWTYELVPIKMYFTADRKLICQRCVTEAQLNQWWTREMAKPRQGRHPTYYTKHDPFAKVCTCDYCNDPTTRRTKTTTTTTDRHFSNRKRTSQ